MSRLSQVIAQALTLSLLATIGSAESNDAPYHQETILGLQGVSSLQLDPAGERVYFAVKSHVHSYSVSDLQDNKHISVQGDVESIALESSDTLAIRFDQVFEGQGKKISATTLTRLTPEFGLPSSQSKESFSTIEGTPMRDLSASEDGTLLIAHVRSNYFSRVILEAGEDPRVQQVLSKCGFSDVLESFSFENQLFYAASVVNEASIQIGPINEGDFVSQKINNIEVNDAESAKCYRVGSVAKKASLKKDVYFNRSKIKFELIDDPQQRLSRGIERTANAVLLLDEDSVSLRYIPFEYFDEELAMLYSQDESIDLSRRLEGVGFGSELIFASSKSGDVILVSSKGSKRVLRFGWNKDEFEDRGYFDFPTAIEAIEISANGETAAFLTEGAGVWEGFQTIRTVSGLKNIEAGARLGHKNKSVLELQNRLLEEKIDPGDLDGILGENTMNAVKQFIASVPIEGLSDNQQRIKDLYIALTPKGSNG